ncbi:hypothetical protein [uncultured Ruminococcus sp.]|uniref:hypothetical protein n=1 Tax=uncultured Ruminococcus sp. TaxID=165186 RepID=UPI0026008E77|nr:hypothetical protein [uncultured Ruminococcus sp.]
MKSEQIEQLRITGDSVVRANFCYGTITEFDGALVKKLLESVKVCEFFLEFRFKSGVTISIEK